MSDGRWRITVSPPDWGQDHLSSDAIVAYVDDELDHGPQERAAQHISQCAECEAQIVAQVQTRSALRAAEGPVLPSTLLRNLRSIPESAELPPPPPGLAMTPEGQLVSVLRPGPDSRPVPNGADLRTGGAGTPRGVAAPRSPRHGSLPERSPVQRRIRVGTGVAVSGLALGALAFGLPTATDPTSPAVSGRGVLGGSLLGGTGVADTATASGTGTGAGLVDAQLRLERRVPLARDPEAQPDMVEGRLDLRPGSFYGLP
ncbi:zf-HC2 domain-containing protein [Pseudonocardia sp.]|uniref:anti-sigma factor family protein n=1 Tax=Pseudonocardia sp. TaxID=60912 RepID=UPI002D8761B2|nr:zf-HC2 domain-containing protein [Pseudonocardia sp.]